jgi:hypothetical protein
MVIDCRRFFYSLLTTDILSFDFLLPAWTLVPQFLKDHKYANPTSGTDTPFAKAYGFPNGATLWEILATTPHMGVMGQYMQSFNDGHKNFVDIYPAMERLAPGASTDPEAVMMVDIGGGQGHQAIAMKKKFPGLPGRYIVQDLAYGLPLEENRTDEVEFMVHDFLTEQPIKGNHGLSRQVTRNTNIICIRSTLLLPSLRLARLASSYPYSDPDSCAQSNEAGLFSHYHQRLDRSDRRSFKIYDGAGHEHDEYWWRDGKD